ncbi:translation initiation factor IF-2 [bacterium]|nr:translation initiation factor IF-2 [bacterium]
MITVRVDELAQEIGISPDELFSQLKSMGFDVVNVTSSVERNLVDMVRDMLTGGAPKEREESTWRRIVSVRKGESERAVEIRMEESPGEDEVEGFSEEPSEEPSGEAAEGLEPKAESLEEVSAEADGVRVDEEEPESAAGEVAAGDVSGKLADVAADTDKKKKKQIPLTTLAIEKHLSNVGTEIPTARVIRQAEPAKPAKTSSETPAVTDVTDKGTDATDKKVKVKKILIAEEEIPEKGSAKKGRKSTIKDIIVEEDDFDDLSDDLTDDLAGDEKTAIEEPTLKVVEIKHSTSPQPARRKEQPRRRLRKSKKRNDTPEEETALEAPNLVPRSIRITAGLTVSDLAGLTGTKASEIIKILFQLGIMATINQTLEPETAGLVGSELGFEVDVQAHSMDDLLKEEPDTPENLLPRPPVVTVMGHVDHGKTSLLDAVRMTDVVSSEAGGITQHIGAHLVHHSKGSLVFLDTPGHEAFTAMRARGAGVTDIVVLVVAADDGVKPQTKEAIDHARAAGVPILVAINKIDKPEADPERVMRELSDNGVVSEAWGGDCLFANVSAKQRTGIDELLDLILLQAEMLELGADPNREARGTVIESKLDKGRGPVATMLVQKGTLRPGDLMVAGSVMGRVRALVDDRGKKLADAGPSIPVEVLGLSSVPLAGDPFVVFTDELKAKRVAQMRETAAREMKTSHKKITLEDLYHQIQEGQVKDLGVVLKADVQGSVEAIRDALIKQATDEVRVKVLHEGTGGINEGDVMLASASNAIIIGFNVRPDNKALEIVRREQVDVRFYNVIYDVVKDIRDALKGLLSPIFTEEVLGRAEIRETFQVPKVGTIAGCYVVDGLIKRNAQVRVVRDGIVIHDGKIDSLRRFKDDAREVASGYECGIGLENFNDLKQGDIIENYMMIEHEAEL